jgi:hypothetical protein
MPHPNPGRSLLPRKPANPQQRALLQADSDSGHASGTRFTLATVFRRTTRGSVEAGDPALGHAH